MARRRHERAAERGGDPVQRLGRSGRVLDRERRLHAVGRQRVDADPLALGDVADAEAAARPVHPGLRREALVRRA